MLDLKFIRENADLLRKTISQKNVKLDLNALLEADQVCLDLKKKIQSLQEDKNANAKKVPQASPEEKKGLIENGKKIGTEIEALKPAVEAAEKRLQEFLWLVPNVPSPDAPVGKDESENVEVRRWGKKEFAFTPLDHVQILEKQKWAELERIAKVSGSRTYCLKNEMVMLEFALHQFGLTKLASKGFTLLTVPGIIREFALYGTGHFPTGREQVYHLPADDLYLSGTAEVPVNSLHSGEILKVEDLPIKYAAFSPCFRREAGSAGKDVRGLIRVHQFMKLEQFVFCENDPVQSAAWHEKLLKTSEEIMQDLELPYRVIEVCTGDMGAGKFKMHDIEAWVPSEKKFRETHSCSSLHDWQARRTDLRYRDKEGKVKFCHTLNNTALATPRLLVPFLEVHQTKTGTIEIPKVLSPFLGGKTSLGVDL